MRKLRTLKKGARYHVTSRINRMEFLFKEDQFKELFLETIKKAKRKFKF